MSLPFPGPKGELKAVLHDLNNTAGIISANWFVLRDIVPSDPSVVADIVADIDVAMRRLVDQLAALAQAIAAAE